jgi:hypothetical protein
MSSLNLENDRGWHDIVIFDRKTSKETKYKIPVELTVFETERMLELSEQIDKIFNEQISNDGSAQFRLYSKKSTEMCTILFQHFQPQITSENIEKMLTFKDIAEITGFFQSNRYLKEKEESSKKTIAD